MDKLEELKENSKKPVGTIFEYYEAVLRIEKGGECETCHFNGNDFDFCYTFGCFGHDETVNYTKIT